MHFNESNLMEFHRQYQMDTMDGSISFPHHHHHIVSLSLSGVRTLLNIKIFTISISVNTQNITHSHQYKQSEKRDIYPPECMFITLLLFSKLYRE